MPLYEFECPKCHKVVEVQQKVDDPPPLCSEDGTVAEKLISISTFHLKGGGWYKDGY